MAEFSRDAVQQVRIMRQDEIAAILREHMPAEAWVALPRIYAIVEAHAELTAEDLEPEAAGSTQPRWKRNVRNFLQARKTSGEFDWDGDARYRRRRVSASTPAADLALPSARELLEQLVGRTLSTVTGVENTVIAVRERDVLVGTSRTPAGAPVPIEWVQRGLDELARTGDVVVETDTLEHRSAFVAAVLLALPGTQVVGAVPPHIVLERAGEEWDLAPGATIPRRALHDRYGGSRQGGTIPSRTSPNVFLFLDRALGNAHGYYDGWVGDHLYYTGHGQHGDQQFRGGNRAVLRHRDDGRAIRAFRGARGTVTYLGEFELDLEQPYFRMEAPEGDSGETRQVIVFRLLPVGEVVHDARDALELPEGASTAELDHAVSGKLAEPLVTLMSVEQQNVEEVHVSRTTDSYTAIRREQTLVLEYTRHLEALGSNVGRFRLQPPGEARAIVCDLYDKTRNLLVEAKGTGARGEVRMAIGQLVDYSRFIEPRPALGVLLPDRPRPDIEALLDAAGIAALWAKQGGFADNAGGIFTQ